MCYRRYGSGNTDQHNVSVWVGLPGTCAISGPLQLDPSIAEIIYMGTSSMQSLKSEFLYGELVYMYTIHVY